MLARVSYGQVQPGKMYEFLGIYRDSIVPAAQQQSGYQGILVLTNHNTGKSLTITFWETEADAGSSESFGNLQDQRTKLLDVLAGPRAVERYELSVQAHTSVGGYPAQARVVTAQLQAGKTEEATRLYQDSVLAAAEEMRGFRGARLLTDARRNKAISVTLWETEADMIAGETQVEYYQEQLAKMARLSTGPPITEHYEVSVEG
ncbi:MAG: antibiotic biosynthesis monooxygenase family protein [Dehalococcoidia bacterium]